VKNANHAPHLTAIPLALHSGRRACSLGVFQRMPRSEGIKTTAPACAKIFIVITIRAQQPPSILKRRQEGWEAGHSRESLKMSSALSRCHGFPPARE